jgi:DNA-binding NarL/FixJ family response regulator
VLVYSMHQDAQHVEGAFEAGALGYVTKAEFRGVLVDAIRTVAAGRRFVSPRAANALAEAMANEHTHALAPLSPKERQVYRLVGQGEGTHGIAVAMGISTHTVESYCERIQQKLHLDGMHALRLHAVEHFHDRP